MKTFQPNPLMFNGPKTKNGPNPRSRVSKRGSTFFGRRALNIAATRAGAAKWFGLDVVKERLTDRSPGMGDGDNLGSPDDLFKTAR